MEKDKSEQNFTSIQETMDIFLAGDKITAEQYTTLITPTTDTTKDSTAS